MPIDSELRKVLRDFRPVFPWSFAKHDPDRWFIRQVLRKLAEKDVFTGPPLERDELLRLRSLITHPDWLKRFGSMTALHFAGENMEHNPEFSEWLLEYQVFNRPKQVPATSFSQSRQLLLQRYSFYATPFRDALLRLLSEARNIQRSIGLPVIVFGGVVKGTATPYSDLDYAIVSREQIEVPETHQMVPVITPRSTDPDAISVAFSGNAIYVGSRRVLRDVQKGILSIVDEKSWEAARKHAAKYEAQVHHVASIYGVPREKVPLVAAIRVLDRVPPPLHVARRILI